MCVLAGWVGGGCVGGGAVVCCLGLFGAAPSALSCTCDLSCGSLRPALDRRLPDSNSKPCDSKLVLLLTV